MTKIEEFLADFEQRPEARNLYGVRAVIEELQAKLDKATGTITCLWCGIETQREPDDTQTMAALAVHLLECKDHPLAKRIEVLVAENKRLREFARYVIRQECWSLFDLDGGDIQELAEKLQLIVPHTATDEDIDEECDYEVGGRIFIFSEALKGE